jgi:poly-gamma-glutamate synthesis protein (capsule biosynthesis protein)
MAHERDELNQRQRQRQILARKRHIARMRRLRTGLIVGSVLLVCLVVAGVLIARSLDVPEPTEPTVPTQPPQTQPTAPTEPETVVTMTFGGDLNVTDLTVASGDISGGYDYTEVFKDVLPALAASDLTVLNFEGNLCGAPYGTQSTSAPKEWVRALAAAGVDMLQIANTCTINNGILGMKQTLDGIRSAGMEPLGAFADNEEAEKKGGYTLVNVGGLRVALVAFTKGMGGMGLPTGSDKSVNLLYTDYESAYQKVDTKGIERVLENAERQQPDLTVALVHWGSEYNDLISDSQTKIVNLMQENGVDVIIGTHSHYVQQVVYDQEAGTVVAYSLGDFFGDASTNGTYYSILLHLEVTRDNKTGQTRVTACDYTPIYIASPSRDGIGARILRIPAAMAGYEGNHILKVSKETYDNMTYALERIRSRVETGR